MSLSPSEPSSSLSSNSSSSDSVSGSGSGIFCFLEAFFVAATVLRPVVADTLFLVIIPRFLKGEDLNIKKYKKTESYDEAVMGEAFLKRLDRGQPTPPKLIENGQR